MGSITSDTRGSRRQNRQGIEVERIDKDVTILKNNLHIMDKNLIYNDRPSWHKQKPPMKTEEGSEPMPPRA